MVTTKEELLKKGWQSIGFDGKLEYLAREDEHGSIQFVPISDGNTLGIIQSHRKQIINLLHNFVSKE